MADVAGMESAKFQCLKLKVYINGIEQNNNYDMYDAIQRCTINGLKEKFCGDNDVEFAAHQQTWFVELSGHRTRMTDESTLDFYIPKDWLYDEDNPLVIDVEISN